MVMKGMMESGRAWYHGADRGDEALDVGVAGGPNLRLCTSLNRSLGVPCAATILSMPDAHTKQVSNLPLQRAGTRHQ